MASSEVNHLAQPCIYGQFVSSYAERKSRFMKWIGKVFKVGSNRRVMGGRHPQFLGDENIMSRAPARSTDDRPRTENDDVDQAIALSLEEDFKRRHGYKSRDDDDLARAIQESLNMSGNPPNPPQYFTGVYRFCSGCNCEIGRGNYLGCMRTYWHPECFRCHACHHLITENEIPTNGNGLIEYKSHPFWCQKYCPSHEYDNTVRCCSCERLESWNAQYISLDDGRSLCFECMESAIMDTGDCQPLYHSIRDYYEGMNMKLDQQIPMLLVERQALNEAIEGEKNGHHHMPETRGLCLSEEQTVSGILRRPKIGGNRLIGMKTQPQKLTRKCEVTAILVLYGLPRLLAGSILAHELMHGWLRLKGFRNLSPEVEEGICQVLSYMWLESEVMPGSRGMPSTSTASSSSSSSSSSKKGGKSGAEKKLGEFFMHQIAQDKSTAYGEGFRAANAAVNRYGLRSTLEHIRLTGNLPL
ncbi:protein DA1-related 2-like isoform X2 [Macadamia integrifolia]|uniref:protein DA1-related 2-like isoform X2 n=1 Tax=Macadamia integrifolia TaxID=60698 RepID=UPI001C5309EA|nr:protein DA1-related 2-like isoform X2 [Macadamia integrifolia]